jgi:hypothetical protein
VAPGVVSSIPASSRRAGRPVRIVATVNDASIDDIVFPSAKGSRAAREDRMAANEIEVVAFVGAHRRSRRAVGRRRRRCCSSAWRRSSDSTSWA